MDQERKQSDWANWVARRSAQTAASLREQAQRVEDDRARFMDLAAENKRLREALRWISDQEPATQEMTHLHEVCQHARNALGISDTSRDQTPSRS